VVKEQKGRRPIRPEPRVSRRLQQTLLAFFLLAVLLLAAASLADPAIPTRTLALTLSPVARFPAAAGFLLAGIAGLLAIFIVGVLRRWRWMFWLVLVAFGAMLLDLPATLLQWMGVLPDPFPFWYSLCRVGVSLVAGGMASWMLSIYRHHGVWALGRRTPFDGQMPGETVARVKGGQQARGRDRAQGGNPASSGKTSHPPGNGSHDTGIPRRLDSR
jgi:hypothetical protein